MKPLINDRGSNESAHKRTLNVSVSLRTSVRVSVVFVLCIDFDQLIALHLILTLFLCRKMPGISNWHAQMLSNEYAHDALSHNWRPCM